MNRIFSIENDIPTVSYILSALKKDKHFSKTFNGSAKQGRLTGIYTSLASFNGIPVGYTKVSGEYNLTEGNLKINAVPSLLYWIVILGCCIIVSLFTYQGINGNTPNLIGSCFFLLFALVATIVFLLELKAFFKHLTRITNETNISGKLL